MTKMTPTPPYPLTHEEVEVFLRDHPDFFMSRDGLLSELNLPHESGSAISLVERQVSVLRERSRDLRKRLGHLLDTARENDRLFLKTQDLVLGLLEAKSLDEICTTVQSTLRDAYQVDTNSLILFGSPEKFGALNARVVSFEEAAKHAGSIIQTNKATCGALREVEMAFLFPDNPRSVGSAAVAPLQQYGAGSQGTFGLLAIGSFDPDRYRSSMGTLFLSYIAEVLNRIIPKHLPHG
jgi:uncharacterized protein YigA (DUF484 family)